MPISEKNVFNPFENEYNDSLLIDCIIISKSDKKYCMIIFNFLFITK